MRSVVLLAAAVVFLAGAAAAAERSLKIAVSILPPTIGHPYQAITIPAALTLQGLYDTLTTLDADGNVVPALATEWLAETPTTWVFTLRPGVSFSNGEPLTAEVVVVSAAHLTSQTGRAETIGSTLYQVASATAVDTHRVRITLSEPDPLFPLHASVWRLAAPRLWAKVGNGEAYAETPVGTGPFVQVARQNNRLILRGRPDSWRPPKLQTLEILYAPEEVSRLQALVSGAVDIAFGIGPENRPAVEGAGATLRRRAMPQVHFLAFVTTQPKSALQDKRVRRALNMGVNRQALIDQVLDGSTVAAGQLSFPGAFGFDPTLKPEPFDRDAARKLLAEAGYPKGLSITMGATPGRGVNDALVYQQIAAELAQIGVRVEVLMRPPTRQTLDMFTGKLDVDMINMFTRGHDPMMDYRHRSCLGVMAERRPYHCDPMVVNLVKQAIAATDLDARRGLYAAVARAEQESPPGLLLWEGVEFDGLSKRVAAYTPFLDLMNLDQWDVK
jgi:peptide/nickel transport system substrate-binding protein